MTQADEAATPMNALVLAASRQGERNSVAALKGVSHKCVAPINGTPMIERVVRALLDSDRIATVYVSIESADVLTPIPALARWMAEGRVRVVTSRATLADSVIAAVEASDSALPLVITTGDNALHTPALIRDFADATAASQADITLGFTREEDVLKDFPEPGLAFHRLKDGGVSSCNLYGLRTENALETARVFEGGGQFGKKPWRILKAFGILPFILYKLKATTSDRLLARLGRNLGVSADMVFLPYSFGPIDVDNPASFRLSEEALIAREGPAEGG
ncbi:nucleotidyltransferase family protein [Yunchengibacter salinarum]|uniref:nucleotidyltransferase family protein n=1 Tax=Yunchengibacter salinarum TaxID=3133399 RepID=UPI0035B68156